MEAWTETYFYQKMITGGVVCSIVYRFYQGMPYLWNVMEYHGVGWNAVSFRPVKKGRPAWADFAKFTDDRQ